MNKKTERKSNLLTVRLTDEEFGALENLSGHLEKNKSDVMLRACKYFLNTGDALVVDDRDGSGVDKKKTTCQVHLRVGEADMDALRSRSEETGHTVSKLVRESIKAFWDVMSGSY